MTEAVRGRLGGLVRYALTGLVARPYNALVARPDSPGAGDDPELDEIRRFAAAGRSDISTHLETLYHEASRRPSRTIVELGVRGGRSTFVLERVARRHGAALVSVDIDDCSRISRYERWHFVREDSAAFGHRFDAWCAEHGVGPAVDVLLLDTSHEYEPTVAEIEAWLPRLAAHGVALFHDTNMRLLYRRHDGSLGVGWNNDRGVIRAVEEFLGRPLDERAAFRGTVGDWDVRHDPLCSGLTVLRRSQQG